MSLKPWREIIVPHTDVLNGTFQQSEFAADLTAVRSGKASHEYGDAKAFFARTYITEGMGNLLTQVCQRLNGKTGDMGEAVIQLQTAFGGGKTHTLLAVYHLATRACPLSDLMGMSSLLDQAKILDVPKANIGVIDGAAHAPAQPWKHGTQTINTLWGELAWQLGKAEGYKIVQGSDEKGTSPGTDLLAELLERFAPCVILLDELVVYMRQLIGGKSLSGGSYESNLSFIQSLTEAARKVPNAVVLASLLESENQAGGAHGYTSLKALEAIFNRINAIWRPVTPEEGFEIVRRRLFETISDPAARDQVCRAFVEAYRLEGAKVPQTTQEPRYFDSLVQSYPIHPEVFTQLYEEWTTIEGFQRTRGVLKLMAKTIYRLWQDDNKDLMILPGSLPLYDGGARNELIYYLGPGWDPVMDRDIDGNGAETTILETKETRFGTVQAARRVARTVFLGSAPSSVNFKPGVRGIDRAHVLLGCLQPGQNSALYSDALNRLAGQLHYLSSSGDKDQDGTRYWFDTRANLRREMEDRKQRFEDKNEVRGRIAQIIQKLHAGGTLFDGTHIFTPHSDVPDDPALRLVVLSPDHFYSRDEPRVAELAVLDYVKHNGTRPRYRGNRLIFLAPDQGSLSRLRDAIRVALAWASIVDDVAAMRLNLDNLQTEQAQKGARVADDVLANVARECYKWLLCPAQETPQAAVRAEALPVSTSGAALGSEIERVCVENEWIIRTWSPVHLRTNLKSIYWKPEKTAIKASDFWEDTLRYIYLPRLKDRGVLAQAIIKGAATADFFGTAYGEREGKFDGFKLGDANVQFDDTLLLIEPTVAAAYEVANRPVPKPEPGVPVPVIPDIPGAGTPTGTTTGSTGTSPTATGTGTGTTGPGTPPGVIIPPVKSKSFHGSAGVAPATAKMRLVQIAEEIIATLATDPNAEIKVRIEIEAVFANGVQDQTKRAISENAKTLSFTTAEWE